MMLPHERKGIFMKKKDLLALSVPRLPKARGDAIYRLDTVQYILRSALSKNGKT